MTQIIDNLAQIAPNYDVLFCDLWGCLHNGRTPYPAAIAALQDFRRNGGQVCLMTNAPRPASFVVGSLDRMQVPHDAYDVVISSGDAARDALFAEAVGKKVWLLGPDKDLGLFDLPDGWTGENPITRVSFEEAEGILCSGPFDENSEAPEDYRATLLLARERGLKMLCANPDIVVDFGDRRIYCAGALAAFYEDLGGEALYFGKPHPPIYDLARRKMGLAADARILAVGDGINTDIEGALGEGIDSIFVSGGLAADQMGDDVENPDPLLLEEWLKSRMKHPQYTIGRLR